MLSERSTMAPWRIMPWVWAVLVLMSEALVTWTGRGIAGRMGGGSVF